MPVRYPSLFPSLFYFGSIARPLLLSHLSEWIKEVCYKNTFGLRHEIDCVIEKHANENKLEKLRATVALKPWLQGFSSFSAQYWFQLP